ncbi:hypothetical protein [Streptomyces californicus]|uniref:hypothetical protein n=1 Tax=Streptomyces californicus TaxID=67351 RepID=UPI003647C026
MLEGYTLKSKLLTLLLTGLIVFTGTASADTIYTTNEQDSVNCATPLNLNQKNVKVLYESEATKDVDKLYNNAKEGKGHLKKDELAKFTKGEVILEGEGKTNEGKNKKVTVETIATSELIKKYEVDGVIHEEIAVTQFATPTAEQFEFTTMAADSNSGGVVDSTSSVRAYSTNYFNRTYANGQNNCIDLTSVAGGWTIYDSQVSVGTKRVNWGQTGRRCDNGAGITQSSSYQYPGGLAYSYTVPSSWVGVSLTATATNVGHSSRAELVRGGSIWVLTWTNNVLR